LRERLRTERQSLESKQAPPPSEREPQRLQAQLAEIQRSLRQAFAARQSRVLLQALLRQVSLGRAAALRAPREPWAASRQLRLGAAVPRRLCARLELRPPEALPPRRPLAGGWQSPERLAEVQ